VVESWDNLLYIVCPRDEIVLGTGSFKTGHGLTSANKYEAKKRKPRRRIQLAGSGDLGALPSSDKIIGGFAKCSVGHTDYRASQAA
jgi:hypothetical protein